MFCLLFMNYMLTISNMLSVHSKTNKHEQNIFLPTSSGYSLDRLSPSSWMASLCFATSRSKVTVKYFPFCS